MKPLLTLVAGCGALAGLCVAAPASAQYYPGYGYPSVGRVLNNVFGGGYGGYGYGYGPSSQMIVNECTRAVEARVGGYGYGYGYGGGRVLGVTQVSPRADGGIAVRGIASTGGYGNAQVAWRCRTDGRGFIREVTINPSDSRYGYGYPGNYGYQPYGYRRY